MLVLTAVITDAASSIAILILDFPDVVVILGELENDGSGLDDLSLIGIIIHMILNYLSMFCY